MLVRGLGSCRLIYSKTVANSNRAVVRRYSRDASQGAADAKSFKGLIYPEPPSKHHSDLLSFLAYAKRTGLDEESNVYKGTHYEYTVRESLARYGFYLTRVGGSGDGGIDLLGTWTIPSKTSSETKLLSVANPLRVLIQCKAIGLKPGPRHIRELEGAFVGAPVGWTGGSVLGFMVSTMEATKGTREALGRSNRPMGFLSCAEDGTLRQMLWNQRAEEEGLQGLGVIMKRFEDGRKQRLVLTRNGVPLPFAKDS